MKNCNASTKCPYCGTDIKLGFKKPSFLAQVYIENFCKGCDSDFGFFVKLERGKKDPQVQITTQPINISPKAARILAEGQPKPGGTP